MFVALLFVAVVAFNRVASEETIARLSCNGGYWAGRRYPIAQAKKSDAGLLEARLVNGTGCDGGKYYIEVLTDIVYVTVLYGCSGTFDIVKLDPPAYKSGCGVNVASDGFRIIGGVRSPACLYPWMVYIQTNRRGCDGSIIDKDHILTTSECLHTKQGKPIENMDNILVRTGSIHRATGIERGVKQIFTHSNYSTRYLCMVDNIGIIRLNESIKFDGCHSPICIGADTKFVGDGTNCRIMGWGKASEYGKQHHDWLLWANETIISDAECKKEFSFGYADGSVICSKADHTAFCYGDGGSPMACLDGNKWWAYGIISARIGKICTNKVGLLTSVPYYYDWIEKSIDSS